MKLSKVHWTPIRVAKRALELLRLTPRTRVLDAGAGVGKFCIIGAISSPAHFTGIEQRLHFVEVAQDVVCRYHIPRVRMIHGNVMECDWSEFDAFYLYNPFQENLTPAQALDHSIPLGHKFHSRYVSATREKLERVRPGSRVVTYHGFGGRFPSSFRRERREPCGTGLMELWVKDPALRLL